MFKYILLVLCFVGSKSSPLKEELAPMFNSRIIGGHSVDIIEYPYQISLLYNGNHFCGGSIIGDGSVILTAAHCIVGIPASYLQIRAGSSFHDEDGQIIQIQKIVRHEKFQYSTLDYDIALLKLSNPIKISNKAKPILLNSKEMYGDELATVTGWGNTQEGGSKSKQLQAVDIQIIKKSECINSYGTDRITDRMICAGLNSGGKDACTYDSGGPIIVDGQQVGIVSWGDKCGSSKYPGVYTNLNNLLPWIKENML